MKMILVVALSLQVAGCGTRADTDSDEVLGESREALVSWIAPTEFLFRGQGVMSPGCGYRLTLQTDGNFVLYDRGGGFPIWTSGRGPNPRDQYVAMQADGNLVIYDFGHVPHWATNTTGVVNARFALQDDGNFVIYGRSGAVWSTGARLIPTQYASPCPDIQNPARSTHIEYSTDRPGRDYSSSTINAWDPYNQMVICAHDCATDPRCKAFTVVTGQNRAVCWLKDALPSPVRTGHTIISGYIRSWY